MPPQLQSPQPAQDPRAELERLRKVKRLRELEAKASGQQPAQPSFFQRQGQRMVAMGTQQPAVPSAPDPNAPNPITMAMRQSTAQVNNQFAAQKAEEERRRQERTIFNSASPGLAFRDTGSKGTVELNDDGGDFGRGMRNLPLHAQRAAVGAAEAAVNTPGDLAAVATVPYAMSFDPEMQGIMAGSEFGVGADTLLERIAGRVKSGGFDKMQQTLDNAPRFDFSAAKIPVPESEQSFTGALTEGFMQYLLSRGAVGKVMPGGKLPTQFAKDVLATGVGFGGGTPRLADMLDPESMGFAADYIRWLKSQPGETGLVGRVKNMAEDATLNLIGMGIFRGAKASVDALSPQALTPTNAGGARPGPVTPQPSVAPPVAPVAQAPVPQGPPRMAQAGPAGAGQQPAGGPATLQATPVSGNPAVARDTQDIFRKLFLDSNVPRNNVDRLLGTLTNDFQVFQSSGSPIASRVGLAEFVDANVRETANRLGMNMTPDVERQIQNAIRGRGRAAHGSEGGSKQDRQPSIISQYIEDLRTTQKDWAREQIEAPNAFNKSDISVQRDAMKATAKDIGEQVYGQGLKLAREVWEDVAPAAAGEKEALTKLKEYLLRKPYLDNVPDYVKLRLAVDDVPLEDAIAADPAGMAHRIQSVLGESASEANDPAMRGALGAARDRLLKELQAAVPAYKRARADYGDEFATMRAFDFGRPFFAESRRPVDVADMKADYQKMTRRQKTAARMSVRDEIFGVFGMNAEDAAARLEILTRENTLNALEEVFGAPGKRVADTLRRLRQESVWLSGDKSRGIAGVDIFSGSSTVPNGKIIERDAMSVRNGFQRAIAKAGDVSKFMFAVPADLALMVGSGGAYHLPMLSLGAAGGKITKGLSSPSPRKLSNATEGMFSLPKQNALAPPARPPRVRGPRTSAAQQPLPTDVRELLNAYSVAPTKRERERIRRALEALGEQVPTAPATTAPRRPPEQSGFGGAPKKGGNGTVSRIVAGGVVGGMAGTFAGNADAQSTETMGELERARKEREDVLAILADLQEQQKFFATATEEELQKRLDREGFDLGPTGADGTIGPRTRDAIKGRKAEIEREAEAARKRLASADSNLQKWEQQAAFEKTRPTDEQQAFRDYAPLLGGIAGALGAKGARLGGSGISHLTAKGHIKKSNALLNAAPISPPRSVADRAAIRERATNLNEFWQRGGSKTNVPFAVKRDGTMEARPPKNVTPPAGLFPDKFIGRNVGAADVLIGGTGAIEAGLAYQNSEVIKEKLNTAIEIAKDDPTEANLARVQELEDQYAQAKAWMMLGIGVTGGTGIGVFTSKYASKRADIPKAEQELAILREYFAKQNKPASGAPRKRASTPPLPPSRPRRKP